MDSKERHELRQNDLEAFLSNFGEWWAKNGNTLIITIALVIIVVAGYRIFTVRSQTLHNESWADLAATQSPEAFDQVAAEYSNPTIRMLATLRAGDAYRAQALPQEEDLAGEAEGELAGETEGESQAEGEGEDQTAAENADKRDQRTKADRQDSLERAAERYQTVVREAREPEFRGPALLGLGAVAESKRDWDAAAKHYKQAIDLGQQHNLPMIAARAKARLDLLDKLKQPVVFGPEPEPEPEATTTPGQPGIGGPAIDTPGLLDDILDDDPADSEDGDASGTQDPDLIELLEKQDTAAPPDENPQP